MSWTVFETVLYYMIEPAIGMLGLFLFCIIIPHRTTAPSLKRRPAYRLKRTISILNIAITLAILVIFSPELLKMAVDYQYQIDGVLTNNIFNIEVGAICILLLFIFVPYYFFYRKKGTEAYIYLPLQAKLMVENTQQCQLYLSIIALFTCLSLFDIDYKCNGIV